MTYEEYRGCENLVYAKVTEDSTDNLTYGEVKELAGLGEVDDQYIQRHAFLRQ